MNRIALIAHDRMKENLVDWVGRNRDRLAPHELFATGTTGGRIREKLGLDVHTFLSGPHGGDAQIGALIAEGKIDMLVFLTDPLSALPHDVDVKALLRLAVLHDVVIAMNTSTADFVIQSPLFGGAYRRSPLV